MKMTLDYAIPPQHTRPWWLPPAGLAVLSIISAAIAIGLSAYFGRLYCEEINAGCGTGRMFAKSVLTLYVPPMIGFPASGWLLSRHFGLAAVICRGAFLAAFAAWLTVIAFLWLN